MQFLRDNQLLLLLALAAIALLQFVFIIGLNSQVQRQSRMLRNVLSGPGGEDLEAMLKRSQDESRQALTQGAALEKKLESTDAKLNGCVQHVGLVRYDAFSDVSGAQSFSAALLDAEQNGVVLTGLLGRNEGRCYGKAVVAGRAEQTLSEEEESSLKMAVGGGIGRAHAAAAPTSTRQSRRERATRG